MKISAPMMIGGVIIIGFVVAIATQNPQAIAIGVVAAVLIALFTK